MTQYLVQNGENRQIHEIPPFELDALLCKFIIGVRRKNGEEYEPSYLRGMFGSFERYLKRHKYSTSLIKGHEFSRSKQTLQSKQKILIMQGKGNLPKRADAITDEEINTLYEKGFLGADTPSSLLNTMWFLNTLHFGIRGGRGREHRSLCWGDLSLKYYTNIKLEYVEYSER